MGFPGLLGEVIDITSPGIHSSQMFKTLSRKSLKMYWPTNTTDIESNYFLICLD
jgi:hypothetical protein